jgi:peptide/nickel transport system substrate-binding protein
MLAWTTPLEPDPYQVWHSSQAFAEESSNFISFCNPEADRLIEEIRQCTDAAKRTLLCREFQRLIHKEQPYTFMFVPSQLSAVSAKFNNIRMFPPYMMPETLMWSEF